MKLSFGWLAMGAVGRRTAAVFLAFAPGVAGRFPIAAHEFGTVADHEALPRKHREITLLYLEVLPE